MEHRRPVLNRDTEEPSPKFPIPPSGTTCTAKLRRQPYQEYLLKKIIILQILLASPLAVAGTGQGTVACSYEDGKIEAIYHWFNSQADSYSDAKVFVEKSAGYYAQYSAANDEA